MVEAAFLDQDMADGSKRVEVCGEAMIMNGFPADAPNQSRVDANDKEAGLKKLLKRKRDSVNENVKCEDKGSLGAECHRELDELFEYYKEVSAYKLEAGEGVFSSINSAVACLLEESSLPFSKLVDEVYEKLKAREESSGITLASVRSAVLFVGQRMMYGIANADADVLEDESESCLWCWETREMKLLPKIQRGILNVRRIARRKIHERVSALSATLSALSMPESHVSHKSDLSKASEKLGKALNEMMIRSLVQKLKQKNDAEMADKESKLKEKEFERNRRNAEKEQKRMDRELQKERVQTEKETKRLQDELIKEERRREKEEAELKKKLKKQQEEAERDQRHREKEEAELKKQLAIQKQATIMERFLKSRKSSNSSDNSDKISPTKAPFISSCEVPVVVNATTSLMDHALLRQDSLTEDLHQLHVSGWHKSCSSIRSRRWGVRRNPKIKVIKELKLQGSSEVNPIGKVTTPNRGFTCNKADYTSSQSPDKLVDGCEETIPDDTSSQCNTYTALTCVQSLTKKLLQFDKSPRPAYYGTWHRKSGVVGPRHPFEKDPDLDYDVDSDQEWEEEDPGESLSDCDKDEEECLEEGNLKTDDEDESEDGFLVPDGYLSENEGVEADSPPDGTEDDSKSSSCCKPEIESEELRLSQRHQKYLHNLTEQALRKGQPLVILNLMHEKSGLPTTEDLTSTAKLEQTCLQALCMQACPGGSIIDISVNPDCSNEEQEICNSQSTSPAVSTAVISESDMLEFVGTIRAHSQGINKVVESLQRKFPTFSKSHLRNKVREVSDFVDNRWQVKKEVLVRFGLSLSPDEARRPKGIATFFSKRCLPPVESVNILKSPQPSVKAEAVLDGEDHHY